MEEQKIESQKNTSFALFYRFPLNHFSVPLHHRPLVEAAEANGQQVRERVDPLGHVGNVAFAAGNRQGTADRERQDVLSADELENEAMRLSSEYTTSENTVGDSDVSDVIDYYEMRYKAGYLRGQK